MSLRWCTVAAAALLMGGCEQSGKPGVASADNLMGALVSELQSAFDVKAQKFTPSSGASSKTHELLLPVRPGDPDRLNAVADIAQTKWGLDDAASQLGVSDQPHLRYIYPHGRGYYNSAYAYQGGGQTTINNIVVVSQGASPGTASTQCSSEGRGEYGSGRQPVLAGLPQRVPVKPPLPLTTTATAKRR